MLHNLQTLLAQFFMQLNNTEAAASSSLDLWDDLPSTCPERGELFLRVQDAMNDRSALVDSLAKGVSEKDRFDLPERLCDTREALNNAQGKYFAHIIQHGC